MKSNIVIFWILTIYFALLGVVYSGWNYLVHERFEWAGSLGLIGCAAMAAMWAYYLGLVKKNQGGVLTEDLPDSDIDDGDPELGEFSPWSWWPMVLAGSIAVFFLGLCIGFNFWLTFLSVPFILVAIVGWVYEYYRGYFAR